MGTYDLMQRAGETVEFSEDLLWHASGRSGVSKIKNLILSPNATGCRRKPPYK